MGFNAMRPGRIKKADLLMLGSVIAVIAALIIWAIR